MEKIITNAECKEEMQRVAYRIKMLRIKRKISQSDLAAAMGISNSNLSNIENGKIALTLENLFKIKKIFNCEMRELLEDREEEKSKDSITVDDLVEALCLVKGSKR